MTYKSIPILLVEDDDNDVLLIQRAFRKAKIDLPMSIVSDGDEAIAYLTRQGKYANMESYSIPMLILLDLKLSRCSGLEILQWLRQQPKFKHLIVVILTSSQEESDIDRAYKLGANSYLVKPGNFQDFVNLINLIITYWFKLNQKPIIV